MTHTYTWDSDFQAEPADVDDIGDGAGEIRNLKEAIQERLDLDHYMNIAGDNNAHGEHRKITLQVQANDVANAASKGMVYTKASSNVVELFYRTDTGVVSQLTSNGNLKGLGSLWADTISEYTNNTGVTIDGMVVKDGQVKTANAVDGNYIVANTIVTTHYTPNSITGAKVATNTIEQRNMATDSVRLSHLADIIAHVGQTPLGGNVSIGLTNSWTTLPNSTFQFFRPTSAFTLSVIWYAYNPGYPYYQCYTRLVAGPYVGGTITLTSTNTLVGSPLSIPAGTASWMIFYLQTYGYAPYIGGISAVIY